MKINKTVNYLAEELYDSIEKYNTERYNEFKEKIKDTDDMERLSHIISYYDIYFMLIHTIFISDFNEQDLRFMLEIAKTADLVDMLTYMLMTDINKFNEVNINNRDSLLKYIKNTIHTLDSYKRHLEDNKNGTSTLQTL